VVSDSHDEQRHKSLVEEAVIQNGEAAEIIAIRGNDALFVAERRFDQTGAVRVSTH
jgi:hypothetical protein